MHSPSFNTRPTTSRTDEKYPTPARVKGEAVGSDTPTDDLVKHAAQLGMSITARAVRKLRAIHGDDRARRRVEALADIVRAARGRDQHLSVITAARRLDAALGDPAAACVRLLAEDDRRRQALFVRAWNEAEAQLYGRDAKARHAVVLAEAMVGADALEVVRPIGFVATMLLVAAEDAGLGAPSASDYRDRINRAIDAEVERRFPTRREERWQVVDLESSHPARVEREMRIEAQAKAMWLRRYPDQLAQLSALGDVPRLRRALDPIVEEIRDRIVARVVEGWRPDPPKYRQFVVGSAAHAARQPAKAAA